MEDSEIVNLFLTRNQNAISHTREAYGAKLRRFALGILKNEEDAEESESDTYLKAWDTIPPQKPRYLFAYLLKICRYLALGRLDYANAQKRNAVVVELTKEMESCLPDPLSGPISPGREELGLTLSAFLASLPVENRLIFMRRYWYADPVSEIARRYGFGESKIKTSLFRTRQKLKHYLESEGLKP